MNPDEALRSSFVRGSLAALVGLGDSVLLLQSVDDWLGNWNAVFGPMDPIEEGWDRFGWEFRIYAISIFCVARKIGGNQFLRLKILRNARIIVLQQIISEQR